MSNRYEILDLEVEIDQGNHADLNFAQFMRHVDTELNKFIAMVTAMDGDYVAPQDVTASGINTRIYNINGFNAVRQMTVLQPKTNQWYVRFDARVITKAHEEVAVDGDASVKLEPVNEPVPGETSFEDAIKAELEATGQIPPTVQ